VWEQPIAIAASKLGLSPRELRNLCRKLEVPYPKAIYWRRKAAGLPVVSFQLPDATPGLQTVELLQLADTDSPLMLAPSFSPAGVHPLVSEWQKWCEVGGWAHQISDSDRRRIGILNTIFKLWEGHGHFVEAERTLQEFALRFGTVRINCVLRETRTRHQELRHGYSFKTLRPSGRLVFLISTFVPSKSKLKREWRDSEERLLEDDVPEIIQTLLAARPIIGELERKREEDHRRYEEERMLLRQQEEQRKLDDNRWAVLLELASRANTIAQLEQLLVDLEAATVDLEFVAGDRSLREWLAWCRMRCHEFDPRRVGIKALFESVAKAKPHHSP
jgi:hypothetical protein